MKGIYTTHRNDYKYNSNSVTYADGNQTHLLYGDNEVESVVEMMPKGVVGVLYTVHQDKGFEFNYIIKGIVELKDGDEIIVLREGDTFSHRVLNHNIYFHVVEDVEYLSINTNPCYDVYEEGQKLLTQVLADLQKVDGDTLNHCMRVKEISMGIAFYLSFDQSQLFQLCDAANFHDVGKSKIPPEILLKPGRLTDEEYEIMKEHSHYTYEMIKDYYGDEVAEIAYEHHEKLDGTGYPRGLKGDEISLAARIICVADAYDAMVVTRPYRNGLTKEKALKELYRCKGTQFDERVVNALKMYLDSLD